MCALVCDHISYLCYTLPLTPELPAPKLVSTLLEGSHKMVRIRKLTGPGQGYYLTCHGDTRNGHSTWVLAHKPRENDQDNFWNLMAWNQDGVVCHKIQVLKYNYIRESLNCLLPVLI